MSPTPIGWNLGEDLGGRTTDRKFLRKLKKNFHFRRQKVDDLFLVLTLNGWGGGCMGRPPTPFIGGDRPLCPPRFPPMPTPMFVGILTSRLYRTPNALFCYFKTMCRLRYFLFLALMHRVSHWICTVRGALLQIQNNAIEMITKLTLSISFCI
jgi:hypothetical protein